MTGAIIAPVDDVRVGRLIRALRMRLRWRQVDLALRAGVSQQEVSVLERGHLDAVPLRTLRRVLRALDASVQFDVRWRGGAVDRLLDERHAALVGETVARLIEAGWETQVEVTYSVYGERGSIDALGWNPQHHMLLVVEVKSELTSIEQTLRKHDEKCRLASREARERFGWQARASSRLLVRSDHPTPGESCVSGARSRLPRSRRRRPSVAPRANDRTSRTVVADRYQPA